MICFSICLMVNRVIVDIQHAGLFAGGRADAAGKFREVVRGMEAFNRCPPVAAVDEIVPIRNDITERAAFMTEGNAAIPCSALPVPVAATRGAFLLAPANP